MKHRECLVCFHQQLPIDLTMEVARLLARSFKHRPVRARQKSNNLCYVLRHGTKSLFFSAWTGSVNSSSSSPEDRMSPQIERVRYHSSNHGRHDLPDASFRCIILGGRDTMCAPAGACMCASASILALPCGVLFLSLSRPLTIRCAHIHVIEMSSTVCSCQYVTTHHKGCSKVTGEPTNEIDRGGVIFLPVPG